MTEYLELWVLGLLAAVAGLVMLSNRLGGALSGLPRPRRARVGPYSRRARDQATAGSGPLDLPPAAPVLGGLLLLSARPQVKPEADSVPVHRPRTAHNSHRRFGGAPTGRPSLGGGVRFGGDRLTDRPGGGDSHRRAPGGTEAHRDDPRGREPHQRRDGAGSVQRGRVGSRNGNLLAAPCGARVRALRGRWDGDRARCRVGNLALAALDRGAARGDYRYAPHALRRLHSGRRARRLRRARHGRDRTLPRLAQSRDDRPAQPTAVVRVMGRAAILAQFSAFHPHRVAASQHPREYLRRVLDDVGGPVRRARKPGGNRDAAALDVPGYLPAPLLEPVHARAKPLSSLATSRRRRLHG